MTDDKNSKIKDWLNSNKIFIETFSFVFIGIASIIVSVMSLITSNNQLEILNLEHQPIINIQREIKPPFELIYIDNVGYHSFRTDVKTKSYFEISPAYRSDITNSKFINVIDCFDFVSNTDNTTGRLSTIYSKENLPSEINRIHMEFLNTKLLKYDISFKSILSVKVENEKDEEIRKYYLIDSFKTIEINKEKYEQILYLLNQESTESYYIKNLNIDSFQKLIK